MEDLIGVLFVLFIGLVVFLLYGCYARGTRREIVFTVKEKGTLTHGYVNDGNGSTWTNFMIYTKDGRALKNVNSLWYWKWRSAELQAKMQKGKKYTATIYGWRIGAFGIFPNIVSVKESKK